MGRGVRGRDGDVDLRELPAYGIGEAAHYLQMPASTLRSWCVGLRYPRHTGRRPFRPLIVPADRVRPALSFLNLVEAHVLDAIRRKHGFHLSKVRRALDYLASILPSTHPLADHKFETDGLNLFIEKYGRLINISEAGQLAVRELLEAHLRRIERDPKGFPVRLYPFTRKHDLEEPRAVVIDPLVSFGRPVLVGTGIVTAVIAERYKAGESVDDLAEDYGRDRSDVEEAIRCELRLQAA
jgi:uncharacterized protein (DUF433 family)